MDGTSEAARQSGLAQEALGRVRTLSRRYSVVKLAAHLLRAEMDRYREAHQAPRLARAGAIFSRVTRGGYARLKADLDADGRPMLLGVRAGGEEVPVSGLSEGTADQLWFALRLASVEEQAAAGEPLPFVVDDVFANFDDERAAAGLAVLADLAERCQVLFFTHHARLCELAEATLGPRVHVQSLDA